MGEMCFSQVSKANLAAWGEILVDNIFVIPKEGEDEEQQRYSWKADIIVKGLICENITHGYLYKWSSTVKPCDYK